MFGLGEGGVKRVLARLLTTWLAGRHARCLESVALKLEIAKM